VKLIEYIDYELRIIHNLCALLILLSLQFNLSYLIYSYKVIIIRANKKNKNNVFFSSRVSLYKNCSLFTISFYSR